MARGNSNTRNEIFFQEKDATANGIIINNLFIYDKDFLFRFEKNIKKHIN